MIQVKLNGIHADYPVKQIMQLFFEEVTFNSDSTALYCLESFFQIQDENIVIKNVLYKGDTVWEKNTLVEKNNSTVDLLLKNYHIRLLKKSIYLLLERKFTSTSQWGILTGMRPVKVVHKYLDLGKSLNEIKMILKTEYLLTDKKIALVVNIAACEREFLYPVDDRKIALYIGIPFCETRCSYCSFPSNIRSKKEDKIRPYLEALKKEIKATLQMINRRKFIVDSVYIGGGTPSILKEDELKDLLSFLEVTVDFSHVEEYTFEAGRPKTITEGKLKLLKKYNITRVCLNPQTFDDMVLETINRNHSSQDILDKYQVIKSYGFHVVNMDLIIGLPNQTMESFKETIIQVLALSPENITVHTLALKKGSKLKEKNYFNAPIQMIEKMMLMAKKLLKEKYHPYYMYRQKNIMGNLENIGFAKKGYESLYNMKIMEEKHSIIAFGAGATSKFSYPGTDRFDRVANSKGMEDYINRIDEMIDRKREGFRSINTRE